MIRWICIGAHSAATSTTPLSATLNTVLNQAQPSKTCQIPGNVPGAARRRAGLRRYKCGGHIPAPILLFLERVMTRLERFRPLPSAGWRGWSAAEDVRYVISLDSSPIRPLLLAGRNGLLLPQKDVDGRGLECDLDRYTPGQSQALDALRCQDGNECNPGIDEDP